MSASHAFVRSVRVPVDLSSFDKAQCDLVRMSLLLTYGHRHLHLEPDGSTITVELTPAHRPIDVQEFVRSVAAGAI